LVDAILDEAARFAADVLAPLNQPGDQQGARWQDGVVATPGGFRDAYEKFVAGGWNALACDPAQGGQGLPTVIAAAVDEMWHASNMAFALCPLLTRGAIEALSLCGTEAQKALYLPKMVEGTWTGTMNLTEPAAGSDLSAVRTRAVPEGDHYRIFGQKIFITYGEHDLAENIVHLVLARTPNAPGGVKGISLFVVPKFLVNPDGSLGARNDVRCVSIEHKLGIHASPTAVLAYGDAGGAMGHLVGEQNRGLEYMFVMMNLARFGVGLEGVAIGERALQAAVSYATERVQGTEAGVRGGGRVPIIRHPDVRRMLMDMRARTEAGRALAYFVAAKLDGASGGDAAAQAIADLLIPVVKGWCTENAVEIASTGVQVHGGMGFIEETGAAQHLRDARITTIYEGTTGIQANDLVGRKIARDGGQAARAAIAEMRAVAERLEGEETAALRAGLDDALGVLAACVDWIVATHAADPRATAAGAVPLLKLFGVIAGGWQMGLAAIVAQRKLAEGDNADRDFYMAKIGTARFYADHVLPQARGLAHAAMHGATGVLALDDKALSRTS
jgi:acyl-CoA dehydrogenase